MCKLYKDMDTDEKKMCLDKINWLATIGFKVLEDQPAPQLIHPDLPGEVFDVYDLNPLLLVKKIFDLGEANVNKLLKSEGKTKKISSRNLRNKIK